jgi:hypothetical protein
MQACLKPAFMHVFLHVSLPASLLAASLPAILQAYLSECLTAKQPSCLYACLPLSPSFSVIAK